MPSVLAKTALFTFGQGVAGEMLSEFTVRDVLGVDGGEEQVGEASALVGTASRELLRDEGAKRSVRRAGELGFHHSQFASAFSFLLVLHLSRFTCRVLRASRPVAHSIKQLLPERCLALFKLFSRER